MLRNPTCALMLISALLIPGLARAVTYPLVPPSAEVRFRAYGLGFLAIDGQFTRLSGTIELDPLDPVSCRIVVTAETASLRMPTASMTADAQGTDLLDVTLYPRFEYEGQCVGQALQGSLLLHGIRLPLNLSITRTAGRWTATGTMLRAAWGMGARPGLAGPEVQIRFTTTLPK